MAALRAYMVNFGLRRRIPGIPDGPATAPVTRLRRDARGGAGRPSAGCKRVAADHKDDITTLPAVAADKF